MKAAFFIVLVLCTLSACASQNAVTPIAVHSNETLHFINQVRAQARMCGHQYFQAAPPLRWNEQLARAAQKHANDMAEKHYFQHHSLDGRTPFDRMKDEGYVFMQAAENIANGQSSVTEVIESWLNSAGHCANIMNPNVQDVGIAGARHSSHSATMLRTYWVQNLAAPRTVTEPKVIFIK